METEQQQLSAWLEEYALLQGMVESTCPDAPGTKAEVSGDTPLEEGQIRLWPAWEEPFYGLLLRAGYGKWKVIPFSPLSVPAIPGEARVREEAPLYVLEGWNARVVPATVARESWCAGELASEVWFWLRDWLTAVEQGEEMPERFRMHTGPRLRHPLDPRHTYLDRETDRATACLGEARSEYRTPSHLQAAEESGEYGEEEEPE